MTIIWKTSALALLLVFFLSGCIVIQITPTPSAPTIQIEKPTIQVEKPTSVPSASFTPASTSPATAVPQKVNSLVVATPTKILPTPTPTLKPTTAPSKVQNVETPTTQPYSVQPNTPIFTQNFNHADKGCNWMGVAGQVFPAKGFPIVNLVVAVTGKLGDKTLDQIQLTGLASAYGPGGFEVELSSTPVASTKTLSIQLYDLSGKAISDPLAFNTLADCKKNLILINFVQPGTRWNSYIPLLRR
jgi:hypothetical protein